MKLLGILMASAVAAFAAGDVVLIQNADVYPVNSAPIKGISLLIQDGKILDMGAKIVAPKGAMVLDVKGLRVYPGMIDSATDLGLEEIESIRETVDTGEIGDFMPQLRALSAVNPDSEHFGVVRVNGITGAVTLPSLGGRGGGGGQLISGQAALLHTDGWTWEEMEINRSVAMCLNFPSAGGRGGRGGGGMPADMQDLLPGAVGAAGNAQRAVLDQIAKLNTFFEDARKYQKAKAAHLPDFHPDLKFDAMIPVLEGKMPLAVSAARANTIHDAIAWAEKQNVKIVILQPREIAKAGPELKAKNIPVILGRVLALPDNEDAEYDQAFTQPFEAYKAGVKFALGTFTNEFVRDLPYQAATAVAYGLPHDEALKALTINPAEIWGAGDKLGSVEKGKYADLLITDGDPMDIRTQIRHLFINGKEITLSNKQVRLYERYSGRQ
ncbi:MAG: amidohydrolase family protein [Bryobacteraceae bacterium]